MTSEINRMAVVHDRSVGVTLLNELLPENYRAEIIAINKSYGLPFGRYVVIRGHDEPGASMDRQVLPKLKKCDIVAEEVIP